MICPHCQKEIGMAQKPGNFVATYYCQSCRVEIYVWESIKPGEYVIDHGRFRFHCDPKNNRSSLQKIYMDIESDTSISYRWYTILELPSIPRNLTKENIEQKIKLYLLFS